MRLFSVCRIRFAGSFAQINKKYTKKPPLLVVKVIYKMVSLLHRLGENIFLLISSVIVCARQKIHPTFGRVDSVYRICYFIGSKSAAPCLQSGHTKSSGSSSNFVPGAIPLSGSPTASSYVYPQRVHTYTITNSPFAIYCL